MRALVAIFSFIALLFSIVLAPAAYFGDHNERVAKAVIVVGTIAAALLLAAMFVK